MSVFLPKTGFNLYSSAKETEKVMLQFWQDINLDAKREQKRKNAKSFVLHDGPPYANGPIHMGHAENKFWKDALNKIFWQHGYSTWYIPGWDSHGLPIETAVEKELKAQGVDKNSLTRQEFWDKCYAFSAHWMQVQMQQFKNMGVFADWDNAYATFHEAESIGVMECVHEFVQKGLIEQRFKPVLWSIAEKTALAYAEVEYKDKTSDSIYILFPIISTDMPELKEANLVVWTTTPWTLSANEAVAYNNSFEYLLIEHEQKKYCIAQKLVDSVFSGYVVLKKFTGQDLARTNVAHPLNEFREIERRLLHSDHVDDEKGTGFVHIAPAHGEDDFALGVANDLNIEDLLDSNGYFQEHVPLVGTKSIKEAQTVMLAALQEQGVLLKQESIVHSYPHSWRSKAPLIFRLTKQWFMKIGPIKEKALKAIEEPQLGWVPKEGKNRLVSMVAAREDWCISRQRMWGVPIGIFFNQETGEILNSSEFLNKTREKLKEIGVKNWWELQVEDIDPGYSSAQWQRLDDIVEIWFESGSTQHFVLKKNSKFPCDVYLEGSDQHRGWFQSSLLISAFQNDCAPWKNLITHGFCLDGSKQKMSKSLGNVVDPATWSADELRLFFASTNLCYDISLNEQSIKNTQEMMFRFRNTVKFLLGMLAIEEQPIQEPDYAQLPEIEKWILARLAQLNEEYQSILNTFQFGQFALSLYEFCSQDLSSFYFDVRKDVLYCEKQSHAVRKSAVSCLRVILESLLRIFGTIMPFFAEEAWQIYCKEGKGANNCESVHLLDFVELPAEYRNLEALELMEKLRAIRKQVTIKAEELREKKIIATSQELFVQVGEDLVSAVGVSSEKLQQILKEIIIVSKLQIVSGAQVGLEKFAGTKCTRCRFIYEHVVDEHCARCQSVLG